MLLELLALLLSTPARAQMRLLAPPSSAESVVPALPASPIALAPAGPSLSAPSLSLTPLALQASPLLTPALDAKARAETASASAVRIAALLQDTPLKRVRAEEVVPGVIHLRFPSQRLLASTMLRFQEHYESPRYRGKVFTLEEFKTWYAAEQSKTGRFSYYKDWDGFNIPSRVLRRFKKGEFDPLHPREEALLRGLSSRSGRFYVIATAAKDVDRSVLRHEVAHGLWYTRPDYRKRAQAILKDLDLAPVYAMLKGLGYHRSVWLDEAHAWIGDGAAALKDAGLKDPRPYMAAKRKLLALQKEYVSGVF